MRGKAITGTSMNQKWENGEKKQLTGMENFADICLLNDLIVGNMFF